MLAQALVIAFTIAFAATFTYGTVLLLQAVVAPEQAR